MKFQNRLSAIAAIVFVMGSAVLVQKTAAQSTNPPWRNLSLDQLSGVHWQWIYGTQVSKSAVFDDTGFNAFNNQPYFTAPGGSGQLLFLGGTFSTTFTVTGDILGQVTRTISIKEGTSLFFPLIDAEWDNVLTTPHLGGVVLGHPSGVPVLKQVVAASVDSTTGLFATLNSSSVPFPRLRSGAFAFRLPATDNLYQFFGVNVSGTVAPAVSDGFFSFIHSLAAGNYVLRFGGQFPIDNAGHQFIEDITYNITVTP